MLDRLAMTDLRLGRYQDVLADVQADHAIFDAPYSAITHSNFNAVTDAARTDKANRNPINYAAWGQPEIADAVAWCKEHVRGWVCSMTDFQLSRPWYDALEAAGYYVFAPVAIVESGRSIRLVGDGPANWTIFMVVARPKTAAAKAWRALPGSYMVPTHRDKIPGGKTVRCMREIIRDYSNPGDTIVDICAGGGTTLLAAAIEQRKSIGAEMDPATFAAAQARLRERLSAPLVAGSLDMREDGPLPVGMQEALL